MSNIADAYNTAAIQYRQRYARIPLRKEEVDTTLALVTADNPVVVEIGCAYGREASYIVTKTNRYTGIDISQAYIDMARREVVSGVFQCVDVLQYDFPAHVDVVFAFASLLHMPKEDVCTVLERVSKALNPGGVVFLSLKRRATYQTELVIDDVVPRRFYYYTRDTIHRCLPDSLDEVFYAEQSRQEDWFTMILQKQL